MENIEIYGLVLAPKRLRAFPAEICRRWLIHAKVEGIPESCITKHMECLNEEVEGALNAQKIRGDSSTAPAYVYTAASFQVSTRLRRPKIPIKRTPESFCTFCEGREYCVQDCQQMTDTNERVENLKSTNRCFLCFKRGHAVRQCAKKGKAMCTVCKGPHHKSICNADQTNNSQVIPANVMPVSTVDVTLPNFTYLQIARVRVVGPTVGASSLAV